MNVFSFTILKKRKKIIVLGTTLNILSPLCIKSLKFRHFRILDIPIIHSTVEESTQPKACRISTLLKGGSSDSFIHLPRLACGRTQNTHQENLTVQKIFLIPTPSSGYFVGEIRIYLLFYLNTCFLKYSITFNPFNRTSIVVYFSLLNNLTKLSSFYAIQERAIRFIYNSNNNKHLAALYYCCLSLFYRYFNILCSTKFISIFSPLNHSSYFQIFISLYIL